MKILNKKRVLASLLAFFLVLFTALPIAGLSHETTVELGTASTFAILGGSTITNTGPTVVNGTAGGDIGLYPGTSFTGQGSMTISGSVHVADGVASDAKDDLLIAYNDANSRIVTATIPSELGGTTLVPGVYASLDGTFHITGTLTLDAQGDPEAVFIFKADSTLTTATDSNVVLINEAQSCRVFWKVTSSATLGTDSHFVGHILALQSITATTNTTVQGQLLAINGAVTLDSNTISNDICEASAEPTPTVTPTLEPTPTVTPTLEPTPTVTPTLEPTPTVTPTLEPTPTVTPTLEPTPTVTPTLEPTPTATPTMSPEMPQTGSTSNYNTPIVIGSIAGLLAGIGVFIAIKNHKLRSKK